MVAIWTEDGALGKGTMFGFFSLIKVPAGAWNGGAACRFAFNLFILDSSRDYDIFMQV